MLDLAREALDCATTGGGDYADVRAMSISTERLSARNGRPAQVDLNEEQGLAVRVLAGGAWGFAATPHLDRAGLERVARAALDNARAASGCRRHPVQLAAEPVHQGRYETPRERDPQSVPLETKLDLLVRLSGGLKDSPGVAVGEAGMTFITEGQWFVTSEGTALEQTIHFAGCGMGATSTGPGGIQVRTYPNSWGQYVTGGYELVDELDLPAQVARVAAECVALQTADPCPAGEWDLILEPRQMTLQIHESVGHPLELDRVLGGEANFAGTSFATTDQLGSLRYGSELVNLTADGTLPGGVATFGWDDEGVAAQKWALVEDGVLRGYLTSREYAGAVSEQRSRGCLRAEGWRRVPIIRMVNISLEPGRAPLSLDELLADTDHALLMDTNRSWSIDQRRVNFQFGCELAWEVRRGRKVRLLRNPVYHDLTTRFWGSCDAICDAREWQAWGIFNCGKGQPMQSAQMSHGSSPARFRGVPCGAA